MTTEGWQTSSYTSSTLLPTSESIVSQALPGTLAAPSGWHSEFVGSTSTVINDTGTNILNNCTGTSTSYFDKHEEYKTLNTVDAPPIIFSSTNETNRIINEIPSSTILPSTSVSTSEVTEYNDATYCDSTKQEQKIFVKQEIQEPVIIRKTIPNNNVTYEQNVSVRYLQPPTPPPPGPLIIREIRQPPLPPPSPVKIRQRPPPPPTPPPMIIRERPPTRPPRLPSQVVEKILPPPPRPPRRLIVERFGACPPKPSDVVIERWLPYPRTDRRRILFERAPAPYIPPREPNLLILHDQPHARIHKEFINQGVRRADPYSYVQQYGADIDSWHLKSSYGHLIQEADQQLPPPHPLPSSGGFHHDYHGSYPNTHSPSLVANMWERMKSVSPLPHTFSHNSNYPPYNAPYQHSNYPQQNSSYNHSDYLQHSSSYHHQYPNYSPPYNPPVSSPPYYPPTSSPPYYPPASPPPYHPSSYPPPHPSYHSPVNYHGSTSHIGDYRSMVDITPSWNRSCQSRLPSYDFSSVYPSRSFHIDSHDDLHHRFAGLSTSRSRSTSGYPAASFHDY